MAKLHRLGSTKRYGLGLPKLPRLRSLGQPCLGFLEPHFLRYLDHLDHHLRGQEHHRPKLGYQYQLDHLCQRLGHPHKELERHHRGHTYNFSGSRITFRPESHLLFRLGLHRMHSITRPPVRYMFEPPRPAHPYSVTQSHRESTANNNPGLGKIAG